MARRYQSAADYAAIGVAPLLIFVMLLSLAAFLNLLVYHGPYAQRVPIVLFFYTMGTVALARVTIENSRAYSLGYAIGLGGAAFVVMLRFFGNPLFSAFILFLIGYLADRITHDCTIIDDGIDSSGRGLIDSMTSTSKTQAEAGKESVRTLKGARGHQPGRTVLLLAAGALPLFGLGQFFLSDAPSDWPTARWHLTAYLFSSLSLLVVTSFLNTRRYLRQRDAEMPSEVTFAWLAGGVAMVLVVLAIASMVPLPGRAIASVQIPEFLRNKEPFQASRYGWGDEGAEQSAPEIPGNASQGPPPERQDGKSPGQGLRNEPGGEPGGDHGDNPDAPAGQDPGGKKQSPGSDQSGKPVPSDQSQASEKPGAQKPDKPGSEVSRDGSKQQSNAKHSNPAESSVESKPAEQQKIEATLREEQPGSLDDPVTSSISASTPPPSAPSSDWASALGGLLKWLIFFALFAWVAFQAWRNRDAIIQWWNSLWAPPTSNQLAMSVGPAVATSAPLKLFSSFRNPVGTMDDSSAVVVTFQALEAWCRERGVARGREETPNEYMARVIPEFPSLRDPGLRVVEAYNRIVYGGGQAGPPDVQAAASIWKAFRA